MPVLHCNGDKTGCGQGLGTITDTVSAGGELLKPLHAYVYYCSLRAPDATVVTRMRLSSLYVPFASLVSGETRQDGYI